MDKWELAGEIAEMILNLDDIGGDLEQLTEKIYEKINDHVENY